VGICPTLHPPNCVQLQGLRNCTLIDTLQSDRRLNPQVPGDQRGGVGGGESFRFLLDFFHPFLFVACPQAASSAANIILWDASGGRGRGRMSDCAHWEQNAKLFNWLFQLQFNFVVRNVGTANWSFLERIRKRPKTRKKAPKVREMGWLIYHCPLANWQTGELASVCAGNLTWPLSRTAPYTGRKYLKLFNEFW